MWPRRDLAVLAAAVVAGAVLLALGYWQVSGTRLLHDQISAARLAAVGVLLADGGFVWTVVRGRRALQRRRCSTLAVPADRLFPARKGPDAGADAALPSPVAAADMMRYHRPDCPFAVGKAVERAPIADHERAGRTACGVCRP